jgi:hypothetical protein
MLKYVLFSIAGIFLFMSFRFIDNDSIVLNPPSESLLQSELFRGQSPVIPEEGPKELLKMSVKEYMVDTSSSLNKVVDEDTILTTDCDILYFKGGRRMDYAKIIEISNTEILYKMCDYTNGPTMRIHKSEIYKIRYANGREELLYSNDGTTPDTSNNLNKEVDPFSLISMILSFVSIGFLLIAHPEISLFVALFCLIFGIVGLIRIYRNRDKLKGDKFAKTGIIVSAIVMTLSLLMIALLNMMGRVI